MSLSYGFYNSVSNDRAYNAEQVSSMFDGIVNDGIYMSIGGKMMVKTNTGMTLKISSGRAWFNHTWSYNDSDINITLDAADPLLNRIDAIVLEINHEIAIRANSFKIIKGTSASNPSRPTLINTTNVKQYPLAYVAVNAGVTQITQANITNMIGTSSTPYVKGVIENISIDDMLAQWQSEFDTWIQTLEEVLDDNTAAHLQFEIDDINGILPNKVNKAGDTMTGNLTLSSGNIAVSNGTMTAKGNITSSNGNLVITNGTISAKGNITTSSGKFVGSATTQAAGNNTDLLATTKFVQTAISGKQNKVTYGTTDLVPGTSDLATGELYLSYDPN